MTDLEKLPVDSKEGIAYLIRWARAHRVVLNQVHADIARKYDVPFDGVVIAHPIPRKAKP